MKFFIQSTLWFIFAVLIAIFFLNYLVERQTNSSVFSSVTSIPYNRVGVLLGTSQYTESGYENPFFTHRIQAAVDLFTSKKVEYIIVSGDNRMKNYNEPVQMQKALMRKGIPKERIVLDYAGFRTLDSVVRAKEVFGQNKVTFISQKFHNQRAVFIANNKSIDAIGYNAKDVNIRWSYRVWIRERLARVKMIFDLVFGVKPKFLGEKVVI